MALVKSDTDALTDSEAHGNRSRTMKLRHRDPQVIVNLARKHTMAAMAVLIRLMEGKSGQTMTIEKDGEMVEVSVPVPPAVMLRAAEIVIERGYGKTPQAIMVKVEDERNGVHAMPIMERIAQLRAAAESGANTMDLEASEQSEPVEVDITPVTPILLESVSTSNPRNLV